MEYLSSRLETARAALNAVLQRPMRSRFAIHSQVIVVFALSLSAIRAFALSPLARFSTSPSFQPAWRSIPPMSRSAFLLFRFPSDSRISGPACARVLLKFASLG